MRGEKCAKSASASPKKLSVNPSSVRRLIKPPRLTGLRVKLWRVERLRRAVAEGVEALVFILDVLKFYVDVLLWSILRTVGLKVEAKKACLKIAPDLVKLFRR